MLLQQQNHQKTKDAHGDVRQDKRAKTTARSASAQPARSHIPMRAVPLTTNTHRIQNREVQKKSAEKMQVYSKPIAEHTLELALNTHP
jgi:hypothetical protein